MWIVQNKYIKKQHGTKLSDGGVFIYTGVGVVWLSFGNVVGICESSSVLRPRGWSIHSAEGGGVVGLRMAEFGTLCGLEFDFAKP